MNQLIGTKKFRQAENPKQSQTCDELFWAGKQFKSQRAHFVLPLWRAIHPLSRSIEKVHHYDDDASLICFPPILTLLWHIHALLDMNEWAKNRWNVTLCRIDTFVIRLARVWFEWLSSWHICVGNGFPLNGHFFGALFLSTLSAQQQSLIYYLLFSCLQGQRAVA